LAISVAQALACVSGSPDPPPCGAGCRTVQLYGGFASPKTGDTMQRIAFLLLAICGVAAAQSSSGYVYFAPGGITTSGQTAMTFQMGVGGDFVTGKGIGLGVEIGAVGPRQNFISGALGVLSPNPSYHFMRGKQRKIDPYITGGYTMFFRGAIENLFDFGAGANYWFASKVGLKVEFRDQVYTQAMTAQFWGLRLGLAFR
jgi:hypothetical protein